VRPDVVQEEAGHEDEEDEQQPRPGEAPALHLAQQLLGGREGGRGPVAARSRRRGGCRTATLPPAARCRAHGCSRHPPPLPSGNQSHLPSSWEDGQGPAPSVPGVSCRRAAAGLPARHAPVAGETDRNPAWSRNPAAGWQRAPPSRSSAHLAGSVAGSHVPVAAGPSRRQLLVRDVERANRLLQRLPHLGESQSCVTAPGTPSRQHRAPARPGSAGRETGRAETPRTRRTDRAAGTTPRVPLRARAGTLRSAGTLPARPAEPRCPRLAPTVLLLLSQDSSRWFRSRLRGEGEHGAGSGAPGSSVTKP